MNGRVSWADKSVFTRKDSMPLSRRQWTTICHGYAQTLQDQLQASGFDLSQHSVRETAAYLRTQSGMSDAIKASFATAEGARSQMGLSLPYTRTGESEALMRAKLSELVSGDRRETVHSEVARNPDRSFTAHLSKGLSRVRSLLPI